MRHDDSVSGQGSHDNPTRPTTTCRIREADGKQNQDCDGPITTPICVKGKHPKQEEDHPKEEGQLKTRDITYKEGED